MKTLLELYQSHTGKVSDKWALYLTEYDRLFAPYRDQNISLLEIGIQNGGSLEIWSQYFPHAHTLVGCDINPDCGDLSFDDPRIAVVVGDATKPEVMANVLTRSAEFDLIIEDGSHISSDIVKAFALYFPALKTGGLFVAEDLHCSYWSEYEGGIYHPYSSISFFKHIADMINHEHWGVKKERTELIAGFKELSNIELSESLLAEISSVEFVNSVCVVRKKNRYINCLGDRVIAGLTEKVVSGHLPLLGAKQQAMDQSSNAWSTLPKAPAELFQQLRTEVQAKQAEAEQLRSDVQVKQAEAEQLRTEVHAMRQSKSWRITTPLRAIGSTLKYLRNPSIDQVSSGLVHPAMSSCENADDLIRSSASFEALSGLAPQPERLELKLDTSTLIAFYLPQYHRVTENSEWWGPGFTEWTNVVKGKPNYDDHYQPHLPRELGFYDLSNVEVMREQAQMAKLFGVGAFCFYYYWFSGRRILEKPIDNFLHSDIDMPYCLCWANENWTRTWDGDTRSVLLEQKYQEADPMAFIESVMPHFMDRRYLKVDGKPMLVIYRAKEIPEVARVFGLWREALKAAGFPGLHIVVVDFYDISHPDEVGADALVEFPPHKFNGPQTVPDIVPLCTNNEFRGGIVDYAKVTAQSANRTAPNFTLYRGVVPSWDNTARRQNTPTILLGSSPELFEEWLRYVRAYSRETLNGRTDNFIFINAWNEWGEGCHLEPDQKHGLKYLEAVKASSWYDSSSANPDAARKALLSSAAASIQRRSQTSGKQQTETRSIEQILGSTRPAGGTVQKIAFALREYPVAHGVLKRAYKSYKALRNL